MCDNCLVYNGPKEQRDRLKAAYLDHSQMDVSWMAAMLELNDMYQHDHKLVKAMREKLATIEWAGVNHNTETAICPACGGACPDESGGDEPYGHTNDCWLAEFIGKKKEEVDVD